VQALRSQTNGAPEALESLWVESDGQTELAVPLRENDVIRLILRRTDV